MKIIGITGGIGSGKSTVASLFAKFDKTVVYTADVEAKKLMDTSTIIRDKLTKCFGKESYVNDELNRDFISKIVFQNPEKLKELNSIVHPEVRKHFTDFIEAHKNCELLFYENAILFETKTNLHCDKVISVFVSLESRIQRIIERDKTTKEAVLARIKNQWKEDKKLLQSHYIIYNNTLLQTQKQVNKIHNFLTKKPV